MAPKQSKNAFFYFMLDFQAAQRKKYPGGLRAVAEDPMCQEAWKNMSKTDRGKYEKRAKDAKYQERGIGKQTGTGESITLLEMENRKKQDFRDNMLAYINSFVTAANQYNDLRRREFFFIHANYFYVKGEDNNEPDYAPAEFAIIKFSLEDGIKEKLHYLIHCVPHKGYALPLKEHSELTHKIPCEIGEKDFAIMFSSMKNFIKSNSNGEERPPLYTTEECTDIVRSLFNRMERASGEDLTRLNIYSLEVLFSELLNVVSNDKTSEPTAKSYLKRDPFSYFPKLSCEFHSTLDGENIFCSLSVVKRWIFTICDYCCHLFSIEMVEGQHSPEQPNVENLSSSMSTLSMRSRSLASSVVSAPIISGTGVATDYREKTSSRTLEEDRIRRERSKPVQVIIHGETEESDTEASVVSSVSTRAAGRTWASNLGASETAPDLTSEENFPSIGGGGRGRHPFSGGRRGPPNGQY